MRDFPHDCGMVDTYAVVYLQAATRRAVDGVTRVVRDEPHDYRARASALERGASFFSGCTPGYLKF